MVRMQGWRWLVSCRCSCLGELLSPHCWRQGLNIERLVERRCRTDVVRHGLPRRRHVQSGGWDPCDRNAAQVFQAASDFSGRPQHFSGRPLLAALNPRASSPSGEQRASVAARGSRLCVRPTCNTKIDPECATCSELSWGENSVTSWAREVSIGSSGLCKSEGRHCTELHPSIFIFFDRGYNFRRNITINLKQRAFYASEHDFGQPALVQ